MHRKYRGAMEPADALPPPESATTYATVQPSSAVQRYLGLLALCGCGAVFYLRVKQVREDGDDVTRVLGDTDAGSIVFSTVPGIVFAAAFFGLRKRVATSVQAHGARVAELVPESTMPLVVASFCAAASSQLLDMYKSDRGHFALGHAVGILVGSAVMAKAM